MKRILDKTQQYSIICFQKLGKKSDDIFSVDYHTMIHNPYQRIFPFFRVSYLPTADQVDLHHSINLRLSRMYIEPIYANLILHVK